jgi:3'(2'), 5'-bisphosphate nucleotidase
MSQPADHVLAAELATLAGAALVEVRAELSAAGASSSELKDEGDRRAHELLMRLIGDARPDDAVLSEEGQDDKARLKAERVWIIDPLDGTREFGEPPRTDWAVHVALVEASTPTAGAVALPALGVTLSTASPPPTPADSSTRPRVICSRTRPGPAAEHLVKVLDGELIHMGSAGAKAMAVVRGEADIYAHTGGQYEWDSCAPVAVAASAGLHVSRLNGEPLLYNQDDVYLPDLLVCHKALAQTAIETLSGAVN